MTETNTMAALTSKSGLAYREHTIRLFDDGRFQVDGVEGSEGTRRQDRRGPQGRGAEGAVTRRR